MVSNVTKQKMIIALDLQGWEQDGKGLKFCKPSTGERKQFKSWEEVYAFILRIYGKDTEDEVQ